MNLTKNERGIWEVTYKGADGRRHTRSTKVKDKELAKEVVRESRISELELASEMGVLTQDVISVLLTGRKVTVEGAIEPWKEAMQRQHQSFRTIENAEVWIRAWMTSMGLASRMVTSLKVKDFDAWINRADAKQKLGTRKVMLSGLRSFCRFCSNMGWIQGNPANLVRIDYSLMDHEQKETLKKPCFTDKEVAFLEMATRSGASCEDYFWHAAVIIGRYTGLRLGDICCLEWDCLSLNPGYLTVWTRKRDKRVSLPIEEKPLIEAIASLRKADPKFIFPEERQIILSPRHTVMSMRFASLCRACGIEGKSFHCLRSSYITDAKKKGLPMEHIAQCVGHGNVRETWGYVRE